MVVGDVPGKKMAVRGRPGRAELHFLDCEDFGDNEQERHVVRRRAGVRGFMMEDVVGVLVLVVVSRLLEVDVNGSQSMRRAQCDCGMLGDKVDARVGGCEDGIGEVRIGG